MTYLFIYLFVCLLIYSYTSLSIYLFIFVPLGLAYGVITSIQNAGLAGFPLIIAVIFSHSHSKYIPNCEYFFVSISILGIFVGIYLNYLDNENGNILNSPSSQTQIIILENLHKNQKNVKSVLEMNNDFEDDGFGDFPIKDIEALHSADL